MCNQHLIQLQIFRNKNHISHKQKMKLQKQYVLRNKEKLILKHIFYIILILRQLGNIWKNEALANKIIIFKCSLY